MTKWATIDRELLLKRRNEKSAELRVLAEKNVRLGTPQALEHAVEVAGMIGGIQALDVILEVTKPRSEP